MLALCASFALSGGVAHAGQKARPSPPAATQSPVDAFLPFCHSQDPDSRKQCIEQIQANGDPQKDAKSTLAELAQHDADNHEEAAAAYIQLYGEPAPAYDTSSPTDWQEDPGRSHHQFYQSGFTTRKGELAFYAQDLGLWDFSYGLSDNVELGVSTFPPILFVGILPHIKVAAPFNGGSAAFHFDLGGMTPYAVHTNGDLHVLLAGAGGELSLGDPDSHFFNGGIEGYGFYTDNGHAWLLMPHVGFSARTSRSVKLDLEVMVPGLSTANRTEFAHAALVSYGVRLMGNDIWSDIYFIAPICSGCGDIYKIALIGIPSLGIGYRFR
jgi:hypothetical protein